jgi:hypothetical protein
MKKGSRSTEETGLLERLLAIVHRQGVNFNEAYQARLTSLLSCTTHGPAFAVSRGKVIATVAVEFL